MASQKGVALSKVLARMGRDFDRLSKVLTERKKAKRKDEDEDEDEDEEEDDE